MRRGNRLHGNRHQQRKPDDKAKGDHGEAREVAPRDRPPIATSTAAATRPAPAPRAVVTNQGSSADTASRVMGSDAAKSMTASAPRTMPRKTWLPRSREASLKSQAIGARPFSRQCKGRPKANAAQPVQNLPIRPQTSEEYRWRPDCGETFVQATTVTRRLAAILCADVVGYSRLVAEDEEGTLRTLAVYRATIADLVAEHARPHLRHGRRQRHRRVRRAPFEAVRAAVAIQRALRPAQRRPCRRGGGWSSASASMSATWSSTATICSATASMSRPACRRSPSRAASA